MLLFASVLWLLFQLNYVENLDSAMCGLQTLPVLLFSLASLHVAVRPGSRASASASLCVLFACLSSANGFLAVPVALLIFLRSRRFRAARVSEPFCESTRIYHMRSPQTSALAPLWMRLFVYLGAGFFTLALFLSAVFDLRIRTLHTLQALIYITVVLLVRRASAWGYGAGFFIAGFWNYNNLFVTSFVRSGWTQILTLVHTGHLPRPDLLMAVIAAGGHFLLICGCLAGFLLLHPRGRAWLHFVTGGTIAIGYLILIIFTMGRQYIPLVRRIFHL